MRIWYPDDGLESTGGYHACELTPWGHPLPELELGIAQALDLPVLARSHAHSRNAALLILDEALEPSDLVLMQADLLGL